MLSTNPAKEVFLMALRRRDQRSRESDCHLREALHISARNGHFIASIGRCNCSQVQIDVLRGGVHG
jgi:hypothetical protein